MENRSRVQEIRQRFEDVTSSQTCSSSNVVSKKPQYKPPLATKPNHLINNTETTIKSVIKRSHAFRSDKSKIKLFTQAKEPICIKKQFKPDNNYIKLPTISKNTTSNNTVLTPVLSETLKKALKAPLPSGPAPKKPPRTFAHNIDAKSKGIRTKMELDDKINNKLEESITGKQQLNNNNETNKEENCKTVLKTRTEKLSKDRILAFIKNFENVVDRKKINNSNGNIYDSPCDSPEKSGNSNPVYSEPCLNKFKTDEESKKINSLHYMSTPIENINIETDESPKLEYLIFPLNKESVEERKEFDIVLRKTRKMLISQSDNEDFEEIYDDNLESPLADYCAMLPPRPKEPNSKNHDVFDEIKSLMIEAYNNGSVKFSDGGEQAQFRALRGDAGSKQLTEMYSQIINDSSGRFRERCRMVRAKSVVSDRLIDALLLIGLDTEIDNGTKVPYVKAKYKQPNVEIPTMIESLVFPDASCWPPLTSHLGTKQSNYFTIVLTRNSGERSYAYCRRLLPEGSSFCLPLTYVILTSNEDTVLYHKILDQIEINHGLPENDYNKFINDLLSSKFPKVGEALVLDDVYIKRNEDNRPYEYVISGLLNDLSIPVFLKIFSALLLERKIVVVSSQVSKVCDTVEALCKCLYPFSWQHTIVSVLPSDMSEMLQCPTPYLVGLLKGRNNSPGQLESIFSGIDNSFVVDVDAGTIIKCSGDEHTILPKRLIKSLKSALYLCPVRGADTCPSTTLLKLFVELVGHYPLVIINGPSGANDKLGFRVFLRNSFVSALSSKSTEHFLRTFIDTAMFEAFIRERLDNLDFKMSLFEKTCIEFIAEEVRKPSGLLKTITLNRTVKVLGDQFLKEE